MKDPIAIKTVFDQLMDARVKEIVPGKYPWRNRKATRNWMSQQYDNCIHQIMSAYGITKGRAVDLVGGRKDWQDQAKRLFV